MITNFEKYLIQEKSTFSDLLPNYLVRYIHKNYNVSKNKFEYTEIKKTELFSETNATIFTYDDNYVIIYYVGDKKYLVIYKLATDTRADDWKVSKSEITKKFLTGVKNYKCYKLDVKIWYKSDSFASNKHILNDIVDEAMDKLKSIIPTFIKMNLKDLTTDLVKYSNEISNNSDDIDNKILDYISDISDDLKKISDPHNFIKDIRDSHSDGILGNILKKDYDISYRYSIYGSDYNKIKENKDKIVRLLFITLVKKFLQLNITTIKRIDAKLAENPELINDEEYKEIVLKNPNLYKKYSHLLQANDFDLI